MPRKPRIVAPGDFLHVGARGNNRQAIFDDDLRAHFLELLDPIGRDFGWTIYGWALMTNHYHLILQVGHAGISDGMHKLNHRFACSSNVRFERADHALGKRFWSERIESEGHLMAAVAYVVWNPARARVVRLPKESPWTSYRASAGLEVAPRCLDLARLYELYAPRVVEARRRFCGHVSAGRGRCQAPARKCGASVPGSKRAAAG